LPQERDKLRSEAASNIQRLQNKFTRELLVIALFLLLSIGGLSDFAMLPALPESVRKILGQPPSGNMISALLVLYVFSAIILILSRMMSGSEKQGGMGHLGYLAGFYFFYHFSGKLPENFWAVFAAGATILGLESYHIWIYSSEAIERERELLATLERKPLGQGEEKDK